MDMMKRQNRFFVVHDLTHGNKNKNDRIIWALQGRFENGMIHVRSGQEWNAQFLDQLFQFPNALTHDDIPDSLAYIDQLSDQSYLEDYTFDSWEVLDEVAGY